MLTANRARELFKYDRETGIVTRRIRQRNRLVGEVVGYLFIDSHRSKSIRATIDIKKYGLHRVIWLIETGEWPDTIDHINGDARDNRWKNLRNVSIATNNKNGSLMKNNKSGLAGVCWSGGYWRSVIGILGKPSYLYFGVDFFEACCRRKSAEIKYGYHQNHGMRRQNEAISA